jgi:hypothetical protein
MYIEMTHRISDWYGICIRLSMLLKANDSRHPRLLEMQCATSLRIRTVTYLNLLISISCVSICIQALPLLQISTVVEPQSWNHC